MPGKPVLGSVRTDSESRACEDLGSILGKIAHFSANRSFLKILTIIDFLTYSGLSAKKISLKKMSEKSLEQIVRKK